jgi:hypothetical protein
MQTSFSRIMYEARSCVNITAAIMVLRTCAICK